MIALQAHVYYVPGLPNYLRTIYPQGICTSEGYKSTSIVHCHDEHDSYAEINLKEYNPGCQKAKPVEKVYIKFDPNKNLPTHESILPNHKEKCVKVLKSDVCVTYEANQNLTLSYKELLQWHFRLGHIEFQHVLWLICTLSLKV